MPVYTTGRRIGGCYPIAKNQVVKTLNNPSRRPPFAAIGSGLVGASVIQVNKCLSNPSHTSNEKGVGPLVQQFETRLNP